MRGAFSTETGILLIPASISILLDCFAKVTPETNGARQANGVGVVMQEQKT